MEWNWESLDTYKNYADRIKKAKEATVIELDRSERPSASIQGKDGETFNCYLDDCECKGFKIAYRRKSPCFHMIRLAMELNIINDEGRTAAQQLAHDIDALERQLALYAWHYYILDLPDVSDREYDDMKAQYMNLLNRRK